MLNYILLGISAVMIAGGLLWRKSLAAKPGAESGTPAQSGKKLKRLKLLSVLLAVIGAYVFVTRLLSLIFGPRESHGLDFSLWPERTEVLGINISVTMLCMWYVTAALVILALILRVTVVRKLRETPSGVQNVLEAVVETVQKYTQSQAHGAGELLTSYILTIGALMIGCACVELFRLRAPTSDLMMTFALALMTFFLINICGIKRKGPGGRIKSLASPTPVVFVFRVISELAIPVSMACRLFGNMLGGMIVMDLLYIALGNGAVGIPSVIGLFFNVFHPLIQTFIFITLTLTFINEAIE